MMGKNIPARMQMTSTVKITRKGRVTIPKEIRDKLKADTVCFEVKDGIVMVKPVRDAGGSLRDFGANVKPCASIKRRQSMAWDRAVREKAGKKE